MPAGSLLILCRRPVNVYCSAKCDFARKSATGMIGCQKRSANVATALASTVIAAASGGAQKGVRCCVYRQRTQHKMNTSPIRLLFLVCFTLLSTAIAYAQDCSRDPILLSAQDQPRFFHTQGYESGQYANNTDCNWILLARDAHRRILLTIHDSHIDDALFSRCDDFCSVRDGNTNTSSEIVRWCGESAPFEVISTSDALYVTFHSDESFQAHGVNMSFSDFEVPGCPQTWVSGSQGEYCYSLRMQRATWSEAQRDCSFSRSNLVTFESSTAYTAFARIYSKNKSFPWTGYSDIAEEGVFVPIDPSETRWPEDFPRFGGEHPLQDCVFLDWNIRDGTAYAIDDCRNKHEYICRRKIDGSTIPYPPPTDSIRRGLVAAPFNFTVWLFILVLLLLVLLILYLCYYKCKEKRAHSRVGSMDANQRLVSGVDAPPASATTHPQLTESAAVNDRAVLAQTTATTIGYASESPLRTANFETSSKQLPAKEQMASLREMPTSVLNTNAEIAVGARPLATEKAMDTWVSRTNTLPPLGTRETTMGSNPREETLMRIRRGELFERPRVAVLDNVSAISLDEFWSKDEGPFHR